MTDSGTTILWELAGRDNNLPFLIPLLKRHKGQAKEKHRVTGQTLLQCACSYGNREVVLHLMNMEGVSLEVRDDLYGYTALHFACFYDKDFILQEILSINEEKAEKAFNIPDKLGWNCLHHAAKNGNLVIAKILIQHNCELNSKDKKGKTPIHIAAENGHRELLQYLFNNRPLDWFMVPMADENNFTALHYAAMGGHQQCVDWLKNKQFLPQHLGTCILDHNEINSKTKRTELSAGDVASLFGHGHLAGQLRKYKANYETWTKDIEELELLAQVKLCICGNPQVGKTALREALKKSAIVAFFNPEAVDHDDDPARKSKGIEVQQLDLPNKVSYQLWDFAGQIESFITHHFFLSTDNTLIVMVVNLKIDIEDTRQQMLSWLSFVKLRNTGATYYTKSHRVTDLVNFKLPTKDNTQKPLQKVPVLVVATHLDQVDPEKEVPKVQELVKEMKELFSSSLDVHPTVFSINCLSLRSAELSSLKDHLVKMHSSVDHFQRKYPRVVRLVEECMMRERKHKNIKLLKIADFYKTVHDDVNGLLSENQLDYVCKVLSNTGKIVYGAQARYICLDPSWLCRDVLGTALAPGEFATPNLANQVGRSVISADELAKLLGAHADPHLDALIQILTSFELCYELRGSSPVSYNFPCFITTTLMPDDWEPGAGYTHYHGRRVQCGEELDCLPPGFFNRFQVRICNLYNEIRLFKDAFIVKEKSAVCLVTTDEMNNHITFIARASPEDHTSYQSRLFTDAHNCFLLLDILHQQLCKLLKVACPNISMKWHVLSAKDLEEHKEDPYVYTCEEVVKAIHSNVPFFNKHTNQKEEALNVLYCGSREVQEERSGGNMPIAFLPDAVFEGLEELLSDTVTDSQKNWVDLCKDLGMNDYLELFMHKSPHSTEALIRKYGENPKRRVHTLVDALRMLGRQEVMKWLQIKLDIYHSKM